MSVQNIMRQLQAPGCPQTGKAFNTDDGWLFAWGIAVPSAVAGYAPGCLFIDTDASAGSTVWVNEGTKTSCTFVRVDTTPQSLVDDEFLVFGTGADTRLGWNGTYLQGGPASGMWANAPSPADPNYTAFAHVFLDDFNYNAPLDANLIWTEVDDAGTGTNAIADAGKGVGQIVTAAADNDYHAISSIAESWLFESGKKLWFEARIRLTEATTNESAWWIGLTDTLTTGGLQANAAGPLASYDGALIWKDEATLAVDFETSNAATQATTTAFKTVVSGTWYTFGFYFDGTATTSIITPYCDGAAGTAQNITLAGLAEMHLVAGVKAGPTAAAETLEIDYIKCVQLR